MQTGSWDNLGWIELVIIGTVVFGFGFYQLWSINREIAKDKDEGRKGPTQRD